MTHRNMICTNVSIVSPENSIAVMKTRLIHEAQLLKMQVNMNVSQMYCFYELISETFNILLSMYHIPM